MNNLNKISKTAWMSTCVVLTWLMIAPIANAGACCHGHKGITNKCSSDKHIICGDNTISKTCLCTDKSLTTKSGLIAPVKGVTSSKKSTKLIPASDSTTGKRSWWHLNKSTTTSSATTAIPVSTKATLLKGTGKHAHRGCCSHHGGIAGCKGGFLMCKDGSHSKSKTTHCQCH